MTAANYGPETRSGLTGRVVDGDGVIGRMFTPRLRFDAVEKRVLRRASIFPRSSVSCAAVTLRTRFIAFVDHGAHSRRVCEYAADHCNRRSVAHARTATASDAIGVRGQNAASASQAQSVEHRKVH